MESLPHLLSDISLGLSTALAADNLLYCLIGVTLGMVVGVLPGVGPLATIALLLPVTFYMDTTSALVMLAGTFYGSAYGGSTSAILLNVPGSPSSAVMSIDGHAMARSGRAGVALFMTTMGSFIGGSIGILIMMLFSPLIAHAAINFGSIEYFSLMLLGLVAAATVSGTPAKGIAMVIVGIVLGLVGADLETGVNRFGFDIPELYGGVNLVVVAMGLFGVTEVIASIRAAERQTAQPRKIGFRSMVPTRDDLRRSWKPILRATAIGSFFGALPGTGAVIASFMSYAVEKKLAKDPSRFGKGAIEGVVAAETANNAADQTAFIPTMTLGIPGNVIMAVLLGALIIHGVNPGPQLVTEQPGMFWGLVMSFWVGNLMLLVLNIPLIGLWVRVLTVPYRVLYPSILMFVCVGTYSLEHNLLHVYMVVLFGGAGYIMRLLELPATSLLLGLVLGPLLEENLRRSLVLSDGDFSIFLTRPASAVCMAATAAILAAILWSAYRRRRVPASLEGMSP